MGIHAIWVPCRCGCGCSHTCGKRYGPYFVNSTHDSSRYLGDIEAAAQELAAGDPAKLEWAKDWLMTKATESALSLSHKGYEIQPPSERGPHLARVHGSFGERTQPRTRKTRISAGTQEFWERFKTVRDKLIPQRQGSP